MKTNDIFIVAATATYSYLFYSQTPGVNFLLFNMLIVLLLFLKDKSLLFKVPWLAAVTGSLVSAFFVFWWGTTLPVLANVCSLLVLAGLSFDSQSSLLFAVVNTCVSVFISIPRLFKSLSTAKQKENGRPGILKKLMLLAFPALVALFFAGVYEAANPIFAKFVDQINFDFISFNWIVFTLSGFFIMFGLFNMYRLKINDTDLNTPDTLRVITEEEHIRIGSGAWLSASSELFMGVALFALLNLVLLTVNGLDAYYMWVQHHLPEGVTLASFLHNSTDTLIFSILCAIAVLLFVFRGYLNFIENNRWLKTMAYAWIAQNILLVITTANINWWYIQTYGLTRKRIGVYVYLLLCVIGLVSTLLKVADKKSNWFLFRKNAWAFYTVFIISCFFNWDEIIVNYNYENYKSSQISYLDLDYETSLTYTCLGQLYKYSAAEKTEVNPGRQIFTKRILNTMYENYRQLKKEQKAGGWQSYCYSRRKNFTEADDVIRSGLLSAQP